VAEASSTTREEGEALARTYLANERTELAWWRTGFTVLAVALAVGRVVPELADTRTKWPYAALGLAYAMYGIGLIVYGSTRSRQIEAALEHGRYQPPRHWASGAIAAAGAVLGVLTAALVVVS
jgi:inner membrane protein YidH